MLPILFQRQREQHHDQRNENGLRLLAKAIVGLINYQSDDGYHIHLDEIYDINTENKTINIELETDKK